MSAELERMAARVKAAARQGGLIETAQVRLLGLDEVRTAAGARWPRMREHVREGSLKIIATRIGPDDAVIPCGDGFVVVFADAPAETIQRRCAELHEALITFYLGEQALAALRAEVEREPISAADLADIVSATDRPAPKKRTDLTLGRFWPVWSVREQRIAANLCAPVLDAADARPRYGYTPSFLEAGSCGDADFLDLDLCLLEQACMTAERADVAPIGVAVHATTLRRRRTRNTYLQHLADNAPAVLQRMFLFVAEIEPGTPLISLSEWTNALRGSIPRVAFDLHSSDRALDGLGSTGVWAAGYHLPASAGGSEARMRSNLNRLDAWCRTLRRQRILPFVSGFADAGFLHLAAYSDLAFATGDALWPGRPRPAGPGDSECGPQSQSGADQTEALH